MLHVDARCCKPLWNIYHVRSSCKVLEHFDLTAFMMCCHSINSAEMSGQSVGQRYLFTPFGETTDQLSFISSLASLMGSCFSCCWLVCQLSRLCDYSQLLWKQWVRYEFDCWWVCFRRWFKLRFLIIWAMWFVLSVFGLGCPQGLQRAVDYDLMHGNDWISENAPILFQEYSPVVAATSYGHRGAQRLIF